MSLDIDNERPRGILTQTDRDYLCGKNELSSKQAEYNKRRDIRKRLVNAILDFSLILEELGERDLAQIFNPDQTSNPGDLQKGMRDAITLFYLETATGKYSYPIEEFEYLLKDAVLEAERRHRGIEHDEFYEKIVSQISVIFDILTPEPVDHQLIADKIKDRRLIQLREDEYRFYIYIQALSGSTVGQGKDAAEEFLNNVEQLSEQGQLRNHE